MGQFSHNARNCSSLYLADISSLCFQARELLQNKPSESGMQILEPFEREVEETFSVSV